MSNKNMTLTEIEKAPKKFKDTHTVSVGGFNGGGRITNRDLLIAINNLNKKIDEVEARLNKRIDNLISKNNLAE